ncbi:MAG: hypothetical protein ACXVZ4_05790 [Gaiellaceae bacterium]
MRLVWLPLGLVGAAIAATYARVPVEQLYHVDVGGVTGGLGRAVVFLNWPCAFVALGVLPLAAARLRGRGRMLTGAAAILCAAAAWPGVVSERDLDAKWSNVPAAVGVGLTLALALAASRRDRLPGRGAMLLGLALVVLALPWVVADLGIATRLPVFLTDQLRTQPGDPVSHPAVHLGHHHGMDGTLLALCALLLRPEVRATAAGPLRALAAVWVSLLLAWGLGNVANDAWLEQVVKRGWTTWEVPDATRPHASWLWAAILVLAAASAWSARSRATSCSARRADAPA